MKKLLSKVVCCITVVVLLCVMTTQLASASDYSYVLSGGRFSQGIENVTCKNNVPNSNFPELHDAVEAAIVDWDWHLAILNERNNKDWNMSSISGSNAMIEFYAVSNVEAEAILSSYLGGIATIDESVNSITILLYDNALATGSLWDKGIILLLYENMRDDGLLYDYYELQVYLNHEIGHTFGLGDCWNDNGVIMYVYPDFCTADVPTMPDLNDVYEIYKNVC